MARTMRWFALGVLGMALLAAGCGNKEKDATQAAIDAAQSAINSVQADAEKYVPEQLQAAQRTLQSARDALAKSDYQGALAAARDAANKAKEMAVEAVGKKEEWEKNWKELNESLPKAMEQVRYRVSLYSSKGVRLPEGVDKDVVDEAKAEYEQLKQRWAEASELAKEGKLGEAIEKATGVKEGIEKIKEMLKIKT